MTLPFGKHKGENICDVDLGYLKWLEEQDWVKDALRAELQFEIERRSGDRPGMGKTVTPAKHKEKGL